MNFVIVTNKYSQWACNKWIFFILYNALWQTDIKKWAKMKKDKKNDDDPPLTKLLHLTAFIVNKTIKTFYKNGSKMLKKKYI